MFEVKVNIEATAPDLSKAIEKLAEAIAATTLQPAISCTPATIPVPAVEQPAPAPAPVVEQPAPIPAPIPFVEQPAPAPMPAPITAPAPAPAPMPAPAPAPVIDLATISRAGAALVDAGKMSEVLALLQKKYGVQAVTQLDPSQFPAFADDLRALGAQI